jgi:hypothetical protein
MQPRKEHLELIRAEVEKQIVEQLDSFHPHGWRKVTHWARAWGITGTIITVFIGMLAITLGALYQSFAHVEKETEFRTKTTLWEGEADKKLIAMNASLTRLELKFLADDPADPNSTVAVAKLLASAKQQNIRLDEGFIRKAGDKFLQAAKTSTSAWETFLEILSYHSFVVGVDTSHYYRSIL